MSSLKYVIYVSSCFFFPVDVLQFIFFFFSSRRRHTRSLRDWSSDVCSSDLNGECHNVAQTDRTSGRMYKIVYGRPTAPPPDLDLTKLSDSELVELQRHKNDWYRSEERRVGKECRSRWSLDHYKKEWKSGCRE